MSEAPARRVLVALGANIAPRVNLPAALARLARAPGIELRAVSRVWRTIAVESAGPDFLNAAVALDTRLAPDRLREDVLRPIEVALGRVRTADRNAPRPIDLDLVVHGDLIDEDLGIPDPAIADHAHLALPLADIAPGWREPRSGLTLRELAQRFAAAPGVQLDSLMLTLP